MATTTPKQLTPDQRWEELEREREVLERHYRWRADLAARVKACEEQYGIPSDQIHDAIDAGQLKETDEVCVWIIDYNLLRHVRSLDS